MPPTQTVRGCSGGHLQLSGGGSKSSGIYKITLYMVCILCHLTFYNFEDITTNISEMVQDIDVVTMEEQ